MMLRLLGAIAEFVVFTSFKHEFFAGLLDPRHFDIGTTLEFMPPKTA